MSGKIFLGTLLIIPPLAALGHDFYASFGSPLDPGFTIEKPFHLSDVAWLWRHYALDSYVDFQKSFDVETWRMWVFPILAQRTAMLAGIPFAIFIAWQTVVKILSTSMMASLRSGRGRGGKGKIKSGGKDGFAFNDGEAKKGPMKYKRK